MVSVQDSSGEGFKYYEVDDLRDMSLKEIEQIWDLVPTEDRDYLLRRYRKSVKKHGISRDKDEVRMAQQYLERYQYEGLVPAGDQWVRISATRRHQLKTGETEGADIDDDEGGGISILNLAAMGFGLFLLIFVMFGGGGGDDESVDVAMTTLTPTPTATYTPSPTPTITPTPTTTPIALVDSDRFIEQGDNNNRDFFPVQLQVRSEPDEVQPRIFIVQERAVQLTEWQFEPNPDVASWISGTMVRPVFGIPYSSSNEAFMESLSSGSEFAIRMNTGSELEYRFLSSQELGRENTSLFRQREPGIVLVLIGETDDAGLPTSRRLFVTGLYDPGTEVDLANANLPAAEGEVIEFPDLSVSINDSYTLPLDDNSREFMYAVVDVSFTGRDKDTVLSNYQWFLDINNSRYSPDFSSIDANFDSLPRLLSAGETITASIAFLTRRTTGNGIISISPPGSASELFRVDFDEPALPITSEDLTVQLRSVRIVDDRVYVDVRIYNPLDVSIPLTLEDVSMVFGFTPSPVGTEARPVEFDSILYEPGNSSDLTLEWAWNSDDPYAKLSIAGRVWTMKLIDS
jgi:hypothetical protein